MGQTSHLLIGITPATIISQEQRQAGWASGFSQQVQKDFGAGASIVFLGDPGKAMNARLMGNGAFKAKLMGLMLCYREQGFKDTNSDAAIVVVHPDVGAGSRFVETLAESLGRSIDSEDAPRLVIAPVNELPEFLRAIKECAALMGFEAPTQAPVPVPAT